jgi:hypothetical protein
MSHQFLALAAATGLLALGACNEKPAEEAAPATDTTVTTEVAPPADMMADPAAPADAMTGGTVPADPMADPATAAADAAMAPPADTPTMSDNPGNTGPDKSQ